MKSTLLEIAQRLEIFMVCNCDLDNWEPNKDTGHSSVCNIDKFAREQFQQQ